MKIKPKAENADSTYRSIQTRQRRWKVKSRSLCNGRGTQSVVSKLGRPTHELVAGYKRLLV
jgi:hypothetical protein